jgi:hypothetical protein
MNVPRPVMRGIEAKVTLRSSTAPLVSVSVRRETPRMRRPKTPFQGSNQPL